jgi:hypothetical protein
MKTIRYGFHTTPPRRTDSTEKSSRGSFGGLPKVDMPCRRNLPASGRESVLRYYHITAEREGATLDQDGLQRMIIRDGKLVSLHNVWTDEAAVNSFYA